LLEDMRCQKIPEIMRSVRQQALDGTAAGIGVVDAIALDHGGERQAAEIVRKTPCKAPPFRSADVTHIMAVKGAGLVRQLRLEIVWRQSITPLDTG
jgi:hypothetical protein